jgi:hypothetical protein
MNKEIVTKLKAEWIDPKKRLGTISTGISS